MWELALGLALGEDKHLNNKKTNGFPIPAHLSNIYDRIESSTYVHVSCVGWVRSSLIRESHV